MRRVESVASLPGGVWTYDGVKTKRGIGFVMSPSLLIFDDETKGVPGNISYTLSSSGDKPINSKFYSKAIYDAFLNPDKIIEDGLLELLAWDPVSEIPYLYLPLGRETVIFSATQALRHLLNKDSELSASLRKIVNFFKDVDFGILGSRQLGLQSDHSDVDLFVYGGSEIRQVATALRDKEIQNLLGLFPEDEERINRNGARYAYEYKISPEEGKTMAKNKLRYSLRMPRRTIKLTINSCFKRSEQLKTSLFLAPKRGKISFTGEVIDDSHASSYPREYLIEHNGQITVVASHVWSHKNNVAVGQLAFVRGSIRVWNNREFISLDSAQDTIHPVSAKRPYGATSRQTLPCPRSSLGKLSQEF